MCENAISKFFFTVFCPFVIFDTVLESKSYNNIYFYMHYLGATISYNRQIVREKISPSVGKTK